MGESIDLDEMRRQAGFKSYPVGSKFREVATGKVFRVQERGGYNSFDGTSGQHGFIRPVSGGAIRSCGYVYNCTSDDDQGEREIYGDEIGREYEEV